MRSSVVENTLLEQGEAKEVLLGGEDLDAAPAQAAELLNEVATDAKDVRSLARNGVLAESLAQDFQVLDTATPGTSRSARRPALRRGSVNPCSDPSPREQ